MKILRTSLTMSHTPHCRTLIDPLKEPFKDPCKEGVLFGFPLKEPHGDPKTYRFKGSTLELRGYNLLALKVKCLLAQ